MKDTENLKENIWIGYGDFGEENGNIIQDFASLKCIKTEIQNIISSLKTHKQNSAHTRYTRENVEFYDFPIIYQFQSLLENIIISNKFVIEGNRLDPFLEVIQSPEFGGNTTASVLNAIDEFINYEVIHLEESDKFSSVNKIVECILNCRFTASNIESDEITLQKLSKLLVNIVNSAFGKYLSSENLIRSVLKCFQISRQPRSSLLLRSFGEHSIRKLVIAVFSRLDKNSHLEINNYNTVLMSIMSFLSILSFYGFQFVFKGHIYKENINQNFNEEEILKVIKKTVQMDGPDTTTYIEIRRMGLNLLNIAIETGGKKINEYPELINLIQNEICINLLLFSLKESNMLQLTLRCMLTIFLNLRSHTKLQLELCLTALHIRLANGGVNKIDLLPVNLSDGHILLEQRELALESLVEICNDPQFVLEIFQNFDCTLSCGNVFQAIVRTFVSQFTFEYKYPNKKNTTSSRAFILFQRLGLNGLMNILRCITKLIQIHFLNSDKSSNFQQEETDFDKKEIKYLRDSLLTRRNFKINLSKGRDLFNSNSPNFVDKLKSLGLFNNNDITPIELANFFRYTQNIDLCILGDYLSKNRDWNNKVRSAYMSTFDFTGKTIVTSLREMLRTFKLPGESQQIERILESFSKEFFLQQQVPENLKNEKDCQHTNRDEHLPRLINVYEPDEIEQEKIQLDNSDTIFILSYSIIMLNTDLHNNQVKHKMSVEEFIKNNRGINNGKDLPKEFLVSIFETIKNNEIKLHGNQNIVSKHSARQNNYLSSDIWNNWVSGHSMNECPLKSNKFERTQEYNETSIYEEMFQLLIDMGLFDCIISCFENTIDIQIIFDCINGILKIVHLCCVFSNDQVINEIIVSISKFINSEFTAKSQLILPIFLHIVKLTLFRWNKNSPWSTLINVLFLLNSLKLVPQKSLECEELTDGRGKTISNYSNVQYPKLNLSSRNRTFGINNGFEYLFEFIKNINSDFGNEENVDGGKINFALKINKNSSILPLRLIRSVSSSSNHWLSDITNMLFRSIEEDDEENSKFSMEPQNIVESLMQFIVEEDTRFSSHFGDSYSFIPSEVILSWILNGGSPYLSISIYTIVVNSKIWESEIKPIISLLNKYSDLPIIDNLQLPTITGSSWEMVSHFVFNSQQIYNIILSNLRKMQYENYSPMIEILINCIESFPFSDKQNINLNNVSSSENVESIHNLDQKTEHKQGNSEQEVLRSDWGPLLIVEKKKMQSFRKISDPLFSIGMLMSIVSLHFNNRVDAKNETMHVLGSGRFLDSIIWEQIFDFFLRNMKRYSIFNCSNTYGISENIQYKVSNITNNPQDIPRSLSRSDFMFAERIITNSLLLTIKLSYIKQEESMIKFKVILEGLLQLHPIIFSLHSERIIATFQIIMHPNYKDTELTEFARANIESDSDCFFTEHCILLMLGILQRMVYIPSISVLEEKSKVSPEFYPGKLSDPQILVLSSLECLGMWLYNPKYSSLLYNNITLVIQTLVTFAIFTPTTFNGSVVFSPLDNESIDYNYDANLQAISLIFSLLSLFTNHESGVLIIQVVHTLCIAASFGPNAVRNHTMNRIQQTLGSLHLSSSWFVSDPWIWLDLINACFLPLITYKFKFPYSKGRLEGRESDNTSLLLAQQFTVTTAQLVLGNQTVYNRQVHSATIVSKIILTRIDLLLEPLVIPCTHNPNFREKSNCSCEYSDHFVLLIPVLINLVDVLVQNTAGNSSVFFSETLKNIILVVLSTKITASYEELIVNPIKYYEVLMENDDKIREYLSDILSDCSECNIFGIIKSIIKCSVRPALPDIAHELMGVLEIMETCKDNSQDQVLDSNEDICT